MIPTLYLSLLGVWHTTFQGPILVMFSSCDIIVASDSDSSIAIVLLPLFVQISFKFKFLNCVSFNALLNLIGLTKIDSSEVSLGLIKMTELQPMLL